jgi:hypothetical protein
MGSPLSVMKRMIASLLCAALAAPGCATAGAAGSTSARTPERRVADRAVLAEYVQKLPPGSPIRIERASGRTLRGTLMKASDRSLIVQPRTRIPEPAVEAVLDDVLSVTPDSSNGSYLGKAIGVGAAAGAGAALAVFLIIIAVFSD